MRDQNFKEENTKKNKIDTKDEKNSEVVEKMKIAGNKQVSSQDDFLKKLIELVKRDNHSIAGVLRGCRLIEINDKEVKLETAYKFHKDKLNENKTREIIEKRAGEILGKEISLEIVMKNINRNK